MKFFRETGHHEYPPTILQRSIRGLYWLRDLSKGKDERIFTYEQERLVWWCSIILWGHIQKELPNCPEYEVLWKQRQIHNKGYRQVSPSI